MGGKKEQRQTRALCLCKGGREALVSLFVPSLQYYLWFYFVLLPQT